MTYLIRYSCVTGLGLLLTACSHIAAEKPEILSVHGVVSVVDRADWSSPLSIEIDGATVFADSNGRYALDVDSQDTVQIKISGPGLYTSVHTFAHTELTKDGNRLLAPKIDLVEKTANRRLLTFGGDAMMGRRYLAPKWDEPRLIEDKSRLIDMTNILSEMRPYFSSADFSAVNLETVLTTTELPDSAPKSVVFYTHPDVLKALEATGIDYVSLGNNHTYDYLEAGIETTLQAFSGSSIGQSGAGKNSQSALAPYTADLGGIPVANWGFVGWSGRVTPNQVAGVNKGGAAHGTDDNIAKALQSGARPEQIDVMQYHGSREYSSGPTEVSERRLKAAIDNGADLVIGHHPHVSQGLEVYNGKLIAYSLGNFAFDQYFYATHGAIAVNVWMDGEYFYRAEILPLHIKGYRPVPAVGSVRDYVLARVASLSAQHGTSVGQSGGHGVIHPGKSVPPIPEYADTLFVGDFETYGLFGGDDRNWDVLGGNASLSRLAHQGRYALKIEPQPESDAVTLGLKTFMRVFPAPTMTIQGYIKTEAGTVLTAKTQYRPKGVNRFKALENAQFTKTGELSIESQDWTYFEFDFPAPNAPLREGRFMLELVGSSESIMFDDIMVLPKPSQ